MHKLSLTDPLEIFDQCETPEAFFDRFCFYPNSVQSRIMEIISNDPAPGLYILEAPMGIGKTEAALAAA